MFTETWNAPGPVTPGGPPILVGGTGERKTARLAAQYANEWNCNAPFVEIERKLDALDRQLADLGRARSDINVSCLATIIVGETHEAAAEKLAALLRTRGVDDPTPIVEDKAVRNKLLPRLFFGDPDEVVDQVRALVASDSTAWSST